MGLHQWQYENCLAGVRQGVGPLWYTRNAHHCKPGTTVFIATSVVTMALKGGAVLTSTDAEAGRKEKKSTVAWKHLKTQARGGGVPLWAGAFVRVRSIQYQQLRRPLLLGALLLFPPGFFGNKAGHYPTSPHPLRIGTQT
ncbi:hypothetical protein TRVL_07926 [Trypanosoma vivax]|uniref:Uncharacterized protein n=1 Tax=Trypanosoma vivax (strain Y486) TaxID=1055687 RepID=G0U641_TRYVY|nr:hypothetical protein TRVL_07926 [Trypanosoma vivax]CCC51343.1 hypothetical protein, unlikely [Trypanosoma vivax Y486]